MGNTTEKRNPEQMEDFGVMTDYPTKPLPLYDYKAMMAFCQKQKIRPIDLSDTDRNGFLIGYC